MESLSLCDFEANPTFSKCLKAAETLTGSGINKFKER